MLAILISMVSRQATKEFTTIEKSGVLHLGIWYYRLVEGKRSPSQVGAAAMTKVNKEYSIQIFSKSMKCWTQVTTVVTCDPSNLQKEFEADYGQPVKVVCKGEVK